MHSKPKKIDSPPDPAAVARMREIARTMPVKPSRSKLAPFEESILDLLAKGWTFEEICEFLREPLGSAPSTSTLHFFVRRVKKRQAKEQAFARHAASRLEAPLERANRVPSLPATSKGAESGSHENLSAIKALKARVAASKEKPTAALFGFEPSNPL